MIKNCPFCDGHVDISHLESGALVWITIRCVKCGASIRSDEFPNFYAAYATDTEFPEYNQKCKELIEKWNTRCNLTN